ncbi:MAG: hypothetical protein M3357_03080 [Actinomycetota bacterium]|nr:hypothetical protein [Actinomycetota bacterium]
MDVAGATGMGSLRLQDAYRIDPNDLRSLPSGVAYIACAGRAAKVAVAQARVTTGPVATVPRPVPGDSDERAAVTPAAAAESIPPDSVVAGREDAAVEAVAQVRSERAASPYAQGL